jgi:transposase
MKGKAPRKLYPSDISDEAWEWIAPVLAQRPVPGRKRTVDIREIVNASFYLDKTGCRWEMLPHEGLQRRVKPSSPAVERTGSDEQHDNGSNECRK